MELLEGMLQRDKDEFRRVCNRLLSNCFLVKANKSVRDDYYFVLRHSDRFSEYLGILGCRLEINEENGVIQLTNPQNYNRLNLRLMESVILIILRILYDEKKRELSMSDEVIINVGDIHDRFLSLNLRSKMIDKTTMRNTLHLFQRFQLVQLIDREIGDAESRILIYNSILMAVRVEDIRQAYEKLLAYRKGRSRNEDTDQDEADQLAQI